MEGREWKAESSKQKLASSFSSPVSLFPRRFSSFDFPVFSFRLAPYACQFPVSSFQFRFSNFEFRLSSIQFPTCPLRLPVPSSQFPVSSFDFRISIFDFPVHGTSRVTASGTISNVAGSVPTSSPSSSKRMASPATWAAQQSLRVSTSSTSPRWKCWRARTRPA